jgi:thymidylate synthase
MKSYLQLLNTCRAMGTRQKNRTGIDTFMIPGGMMQFDLAEGFPILTTKKVNFSAIVAELLCFIRGYTSAADFRRMGCKIWDANANQNATWLNNPYRKGEDDLGRIYGAQWRDWAGNDNPPIDQLAKAIEKIGTNPTDRRNIVTAWNPGEIDQMALPPCHLLYQFIVEQGRGALHICMYMRSCDMFLGVPFNISSYALLLALMAKATGYEPGKLTMFLADVHIYENHLNQVDEQLLRDPMERPSISIRARRHHEQTALQYLETIEPIDIGLINYTHHPAIKADMAV